MLRTSEMKADSAFKKSNLVRENLKRNLVAEAQLVHARSFPGVSKSEDGWEYNFPRALTETTQLMFPMKNHIPAMLQQMKQQAEEEQHSQLCTLKVGCFQ